MTNRLQNAAPTRAHSNEFLPPLPIIDWSAIDREKPALDKHKPGKDDPLPSSDIVVITYTSAEWSALDHVFCGSGSTRHRTSDKFRTKWHRRVYHKKVKRAYGQPYFSSLANHLTRCFTRHSVTISIVTSL